jgi:predicted Zn-dependent protease
MSDDLDKAKARAAAHPDDVEAQIACAYAHDRVGLEAEAIRYYERAWALGVPEPGRKGFIVGFGSTLRNVGRAEDAVNVLAEAIAGDPHYPPYAAFLALALADTGHPKAALATLLGCALDAARDDAFDGYQRALAAYHRELLENAVS